LRNELEPDSIVFVAEEGGESEELTTGWRPGLPQSGGRAGVTGAALNTGFRQSTETESCLEPIWRRKNYQLPGRVGSTITWSHSWYNCILSNKHKIGCQDGCRELRWRNRTNMMRWKGNETINGNTFLTKVLGGSSGKSTCSPGKVKGEPYTALET